MKYRCTGCSWNCTLIVESTLAKPPKRCYHEMGDGHLKPHWMRLWPHVDADMLKELGWRNTNEELGKAREMTPDEMIVALELTGKYDVVGRKW
jgi:hypothetical protein